MEMAGINIFYIVPIMVFGPVVFFVLFKAIGIQTLFTLNDEQKELQRKSRALESALNIETAKSARYKKAKLTPAKIAAQAMLYAPFLLFIGYFSSYPSYQYAPENSAQIKLSFTLLGERKIPCTVRDAGEQSDLKPNMRTAKNCSRERNPVRVVFSLDGKEVFNHSADPAGLRDDGPSSFYQTFIVPAGNHELAVSIFNNDETIPLESFARTITLSSGQAIALTHDTTEGIVIH
ncbi:MAG: hypothetical protein OEX17_06200 [Rhodospirillaceae bacterium]|nr:hypothetical protein [Rhodospirillaceae bacterium]